MPDPHVKVTFHIEATDPDHPTGLTEEDFKGLMQPLVMRWGAEDFEATLEEEA